MNKEESEQYLLDHLEKDHPGLYDWAAMNHERRAHLHWMDPHRTVQHTHHVTVYVP